MSNKVFFKDFTKLLHFFGYNAIINLYSFILITLFGVQKRMLCIYWMCFNIFFVKLLKFLDDCAIVILYGCRLVILRYWKYMFFMQNYFKKIWEDIL